MELLTLTTNLYQTSTSRSAHRCAASVLLLLRGALSFVGLLVHTVRVGVQLEEVNAELEKKEEMLKHYMQCAVHPSHQAACAKIRLLQKCEHKRTHFCSNGCGQSKGRCQVQCWAVGNVCGSKRYGPSGCLLSCLPFHVVIYRWMERCTAN